MDEFDVFSQIADYAFYGILKVRDLPDEIAMLIAEMVVGRTRRRLTLRRPPPLQVGHRGRAIPTEDFIIQSDNGLRFLPGFFYDDHLFDYLFRRYLTPHRRRSQSPSFTN